MTNMNTPPPLTILYQDDCIVAVDKPAGQLVIPSDTPQPDDEITMKILRDQLEKQVHPIHRLDRPTSGVLLFATDQNVARALHSAFQQHEVQKIYWAVISGQPEVETWSCHEPLRKNDAAAAKPAETNFRLIEHLDHGLSLIEAEPKSGRFHQIRRHLAHQGYPIVGDYRYAGITQSDHLGSLLNTGTRMLLQSRSLRFQHPITGIELLVEATKEPLIQGLR